MAYGNGVNAPYGLKPSRHLNGDTWNGQLQVMPIISGVVGNIFMGDPIKYKNDGSIELAVANDAICGVFWGCYYIAANGVPTYSPYYPSATSTLGNQNINAFVINDPTVVFDIQVSNSQNIAAPVAVANVSITTTDYNNNANFTVAGGGGGITNPAGGSTTTGISAYYLDKNSSAAGNATYNLRIWGLVPTVDNGNAIAYNSALVSINNHQLNSGTGTAGV